MPGFLDNQWVTSSPSSDLSLAFVAVNTFTPLNGVMIVPLLSPRSALVITRIADPFPKLVTSYFYYVKLVDTSAWIYIEFVILLQRCSGATKERGNA